MIKIIAGTSSLPISKAVSALLNTKLLNTEFVRFDNSELRVRIQDDVSNSHVYVIQSASNPTDENYMELFFTGDALKRSEAKKVTAIIPYFGYARQNIQHRSGENVSANVIVKFIETLGFDEVILFDIHDEATLGIFSIPVVHLSGMPTLAQEVSNYLKDEVSDAVVVSPDQSGVERARVFADSLFKNKKSDIVVVEKKRDLDKLHQSRAIEVYGDVKDKIAILVDDIATSGNTLVNATNLVLENGAKKVIAVIVHPDFSPKAVQKINESKIERFFTTDTIVLKENQISEKIKVTSIAPVIAEHLKSSI
ncbi:MAG: ribose-phosphate pyrophosphokinase [Patescibacteria group bacterium]